MLKVQRTAWVNLAAGLLALVAALRDVWAPGLFHISSQNSDRIDRVLGFALIYCFGASFRNFMRMRRATR